MRQKAAGRGDEYHRRLWGRGQQALAGGRECLLTVGCSRRCKPRQRQHTTRGLWSPAPRRARTASFHLARHWKPQLPWLLRCSPSAATEPWEIAAGAGQNCRTRVGVGIGGGEGAQTVMSLPSSGYNSLFSTPTDLMSGDGSDECCRCESVSVTSGCLPLLLISAEDPTRFCRTLQ